MQPKFYEVYIYHHIYIASQKTFLLSAGHSTTLSIKHEEFSSSYKFAGSLTVHACFVKMEYYCVEWIQAFDMYNTI